jgi:hypothetical protein
MGFDIQAWCQGFQTPVVFPASACKSGSGEEVIHAQVLHIVPRILHYISLLSASVVQWSEFLST